ncbi:T9SS type A sorting domain-containing protein [Cryomorphaceae bacterium 1068]|nr:T9SS type A sorting domain-containing protein [Cryomorphaceae bacterium 1068]
MRKINYCLFSALYLSSLSMQVDAQTPEWQSVTESGGAESETARLISEDQDGNVFVAGNYSGDFSYAGQSFEYSENENPSGSDAFLSKLSPDGTTVWSINLGNPNTQLSYFSGLVNDFEGNTYLCGIIQPTVPGLMVSFAGFEVIANPPNSAFLCKIDADGNGVWIKTFSASGSDFLITVNPSLGIDSNDDLILGGSFTGTLDLDGTILSVIGNHFDHFTSKFDSDGNVLWAKSFGSSNTEQLLTLSVASDDGIFLGGSWSGDSLFLGDLVVVNDDPLVGDNFDRWIGKLNSDGEEILLSREAVGGSNPFLVNPAAIAPAADGGAMILSGVYNPITIGGEEISENGVLMTKYNFEGQLASVEFIAELTPSGTIIPDGNGNYFYAGNFTTPEITIGTDVFSNMGGATGTTDAVLIQCDENGATNYALQIGDVENESISRLRLMSSSQLLVAGTYNSSSLSLGGETLENIGFLTNDFFLGNLDFTTGLIEWNDAEEISVFPNPASDLLSIDLPSIERGNSKVSIFDMNGRVVYQANERMSKVKRLDVSFLENGIYVLDIQGAEAHYVSKFIVNK